jgi:hypothetical protein
MFDPGVAFDPGMEGDSTAAAVDAFRAAEQAKQRAECDEFLIVADWPDR